jgi:hypothetical protein
MRMFHISCIIFMLLTLSTLGSSQSTEASARLDSLRREVALFRQALDSLRALSPATADQSDQLDALEQRLDKRLQELEIKIDAVSRATAPTVLNPRMTAFINFAARSDSKTVLDLADNTNAISNKPFLRTLELELRNPVDPYAEAIAILSVENQAGKEFSVDAEEAYGLIKRLPILESAPLGMKLKIGKFRAPLGEDNKIHMHDLPWTTRPLVVAGLLGTEHGDFFESGFNATGMDFDFFLPNPIPQTTLEMNIDVVRAGELRLLKTASPTSQPAYLSHLTFSKDWANEHLLILGASGYTESGTPSARLVGADLTYRWAPSEQRESHSFVAGGEFYAGRTSSPDSVGREVRSTPMGWFGYLQYQSSYWLYWGVRYDWLRDGLIDQTLTRAASGYLSYYTTEFLRFRLGLEHRWSDVPAMDNLTTGIFEVNFVFGSHPTEPYWVNR